MLILADKIKFLHVMKYALKLIIIVSFFVFIACESSPYKRRMIQFFRQGNEALKKKEYNQAIQYYTQGIKVDSSLADIFNNRGIAQFQKGNWQMAIDDYKQALKIKPDYSDALYNRANALIELAKYEAAIEDLNQVIELNPDSVYVILNRARAKLLRNDFKGALPDLSRAIALEPENPAAYDSRGYVYMRLGNKDLAQKDLRKAIELNEDQDLALANLALLNLYIDKNDLKAARVYLDQAYEMKPEDLYIQNALAWYYFISQDTLKTQEMSEKILDQAPKNALALRSLGASYLDRDTPKSITLLQKALELDPLTPWASYLLSQAYTKNSQMDSACNYWKKSQAIHPRISDKSWADNCNNEVR